MKNTSISEAAAHFGVPESTLRYYEKKGLLPHLRRDGAGRRIFSEFHMTLLQVILNLKRTNMPLDSIRQYVVWVVEGEDTTGLRLDMLLKHRQSVLGEIAGMQQALDGIDIKIGRYEERIENREKGAFEQDDDPRSRDQNHRKEVRL
ncbi:MerR family transcriptional regulator [Saccharibacillus kuerlensis]|uniref:MerR family transcriptional regulator n=1 Tax=Saccharibacillus kuerlensis TaxID=459527 RepID=A0ABQ2LAC5_9BACL|nr:MerR family transcriptional regulator [Saccharibacillus kuerlensis]GGO08342.1 MerR family transcriptional regulator [Saccharibacillus kuerlensis]